jgi:uncharacterized membrane protein
MIELWVLYSLVAFLGYFLINFFLKVLASENPFMVTLLVYAAAAVAMFIVLLPKMEFSIDFRPALIAIILGVLSAFTTVVALKALDIAPNPGYAVSIYSANFVLLAIVSVFAFGSSFNLMKFIGVLLTFAGMIMLSI